MLTAARAPSSEARQWLADVFNETQDESRQDVKWVGGLIGLGPGLTPSGDDALGGIMIALHALRRPDAVQRLANRAIPLVASLGNRISAAHLSAAAKGQGHAAIHHVMNDLLAGKNGTIDIRLDAVGRIGHTSGWDTLAGIVITIEMWLAAQGIQCRAA